MLSISHPTLLIDEARVRRNVRRMAKKAGKSGNIFRPHFKTHQSGAVGAWCREEGVSKITVSSVQMARYFARHGWNDITIAFPVNLREMDAIHTLATEVQLGLLVEHPHTAEVLVNNFEYPASVWIEVDVGDGRSGISWEDKEQLQTVAGTLSKAEHLTLQGILSHAGHAYAARSAQKVHAIYHAMMKKMETARDQLAGAGFGKLRLSVGDTPTCSVVDDLRAADEIRPGNFVLYDVMQEQIGACRTSDIAVALACPVVSVKPARREAIIYGGAVHLSKDFIEATSGVRSFGKVAQLRENGWDEPVDGAYVRSLSQEHGVVSLPADLVRKLHPGDLLAILPVHACLTVDAMRGYLTTGGERLRTYHGER